MVIVRENVQTEYDVITSVREYEFYISSVMKFHTLIWPWLILLRPFSFSSILLHIRESLIFLKIEQK